MKRLATLLILTLSLAAANILQQAIEKAPAGAHILLPKGRYAGAVTINKPLTIEGKEAGVVIEGKGNGSVVTVTAPNVTLKNLTIANSGERRERLDAGIRIENAPHCSVTNCTIKEVLYGITVNLSDHTTITLNTIRSKPLPIPQRGDAVKLWYSNHTLLKNNTIQEARDVAFAFCQDNRITDNRFEHNRFALHFENSKQTAVTDNTFTYNEVGILMMGGRDVNITGNHLSSSQGVAGIAVVADKVSHLDFSHNTLRFNTKALYIDMKRNEKGFQRRIADNRFLYNGEALHFHSYIRNNIITGNIIRGNLEDVVKDVKGPDTRDNAIAYNFWGRYEGFDKDRDNIGDTPYRIYLYTDQLWLFKSSLKFFYATPVLSLVEFLARLAPFSEPLLLLEDPKPLMAPADTPRLHIPLSEHSQQ